MAKLFGANILRSLIITAIAMLISGGINIGVNYFCVRVIGMTSAPFYVFAVITIVVSGTVMKFVKEYGEDNDIIFPEIMQSKDSKWLKLIEKGKKIKWSKIKLSLLPHLFVGIAMIAVTVLRLSHWVDVTDNPPNNPILNSALYAITATMAALVTQFGFYFAYKSRYSDTRCDKCGHVLCLVMAGVHSVNSSTETETQEVNESRYREWEWDGKVYGGYGEGYFRRREITTKTTNYNCRCVICGNEQLHSKETGKEVSKWSDD